MCDYDDLFVTLKNYHTPNELTAIFYIIKGQIKALTNFAQYVNEGEVYSMLGYYYDTIETDYDLMKKYYFNARR